MSDTTPKFPRKIADGIYWLGTCNEIVMDGQTFHLHLCPFLLVGSTHTMLIDTNTPTNWPVVGAQIEEVLAGRDLDYVFPTHPEVPHAGAISLVLSKYPGAKIVGDSRDFHLYFPDLVDRVIDKKPGDELDLGDMQFVFLPALMKDLPNSLWGFERTRQVMFVADGFGFAHSGPDMPEHDEAIHRPGDCAKTSSELADGLDANKASILLRAALYWSRFVDPELLFKGVNQLFRDYPTKIIAPGHGNVVDDIEAVYPVIHGVHNSAFESAMQGRYREPGGADAPVAVSRRERPAAGTA